MYRAVTHSTSIAAQPTVRSASHSARLVTQPLPRSVSQTRLGCSEPSDCPNGVDACHGGVCVPPSLVACADQAVPGGDCSYAVNGETIEGTCFGVAPPFACLTECDPINGVGCANPLNPCQPTGAIGDPSTDYVCIPGGTFSGIEDCPSGTAAYADGACITPSALAVDCLPSVGSDGNPLTLHRQLEAAARSSSSTQLLKAFVLATEHHRRPVLSDVMHRLLTARLAQTQQRPVSQVVSLIQMTRRISQRVSRIRHLHQVRIVQRVRMASTQQLVLV